MSKAFHFLAKKTRNTTVKITPTTITMMMSLDNTYLLMLMVIVSSQWRQVCSTSSANNNNIWLDFEILNYRNEDGRLESGDCCSGYKSSLDGGSSCRGNSSCFPFWKICLTHVAPTTMSDRDYDNFFIPLASRTLPSFLPRASMASSSSVKKRRNSSKIKTPSSTPSLPAKTRTKNSSISSVTSSSSKSSNSSSKSSTSNISAVNTSSSIFKTFLNRIWVPTVKVAQTLGNFVITGDFDPSTLYDQEEASACSIAFFSTNVTQPHDFPVVLRAKVPKGIFSSVSSLTRSASFSRLADASLPSSWRSRSTDSESGEASTSTVKLQKVVVVVEIWNKGDESHEDKLIARLVEHKNISIQTMSPETAKEHHQWEEGGMPSSANNSRERNKTASSLDSSLTDDSLTSGVNFAYRWRIVRNNSVSYEGEETPVETTTKIICQDGFRGSDCKEAICASGCHPSHGYCEKPGECKCKFGWTGESCQSCTRMPGCVHGNCIKPFECRCEEGWTGMFCDKPTCKIGCHPQNGYCENPGECKCRFGFRGENCSDCATMPGCQRGSCDQPLDCNCDIGWKGLFCSIPLCSSGCDLDHGWCRRPEECRCRVGWTGKNCTQCVPYPGCEHGSCSDPWTCNCQPGWGGLTCSEKLEYCQSHENPCQNGGTCVSVEKSDGGFICQCPSGYEGKTCESPKS